MNCDARRKRREVDWIVLSGSPLLGFDTSITTRGYTGFANVQSGVFPTLLLTLICLEVVSCPNQVAEQPKRISQWIRIFGIGSGRPMKSAFTIKK
jgi:hypothetical protein